MLIFGRYANKPLRYSEALAMLLRGFSVVTRKYNTVSFISLLFLLLPPFFVCSYYILNKWKGVHDFRFLYEIASKKKQKTKKSEFALRWYILMAMFCNTNILEAVPVFISSRSKTIEECPDRCSCCNNCLSNRLLTICISVLKFN